MSQVYTLEPPTNGKVVLRTTMGDLDIELWSKEAPRAVRNFVQLCMEGYYDGTIFHRIMKDFMMQGGDPTGTGDGGESIYGQPFRDEIHTRLKFNHRGLVACANQNAPNTNGSQFFITFDRADHLDKKATIFGKITGDTVYNLLRFNDLETDSDDRPVDPPILQRADVVMNPFDDIKPRVNREAAGAAETAKSLKKSEEEEKKKKRKGSKNFALISFGDEAEEEDAAHTEVAASIKITSAHDALDDEKLSKEAALEIDLAKVRSAMQAAKGAAGAGRATTDADDTEEGFADRMRQKIQAKRKAFGPAPVAITAAAEDKAQEGGRELAAAVHHQRGPSESELKERSEDEEEDDEDGPGSNRPPKRSRMDGLAANNRATAAVVAPSRQIQVQDKELLTRWESRRQEYKERKRLGGRREKDTMSKLASFMDKLKSKGGKTGGDNKGNKEATAGGEGEAQQAQPTSLGRTGGDEGKDTGTAHGTAGYDGKVDNDIDHRAYMPAAWRLDSYIGGEGDGQQGEMDDDSLDALRGHRLAFGASGGGGSGGRDGMARTENVNDYVVLDPLLEAGKAKFNKEQQKRKKRENEWAGKSRD